MDQLFCIGMTMQGMGWLDLMALTDMDRIELVQRCSDFNDRQQSQLDSAQARMR